VLWTIGHLARSPLTPPRSWELGGAGRYANLFLKHLPAARERITGEAAGSKSATVASPVGVKLHAADVAGAADGDPFWEERVRLAAWDAARGAVAALTDIKKPERLRFEIE
jgi:hypothetical protein